MAYTSEPEPLVFNASMESENAAMRSSILTISSGIRMQG
jgi:hypothetical protein